MPACLRLTITAFALSLLGASISLAQPAPGGGGPGRFGRSDEKIEPDKLPFELGVATIPDRAMFEKLSYQGPMRMDAYLSDIECVKFIVEGVLTEKSKTYWMNTQNIQAHPQFMGAIGMQGGPGGGRGRGGPPGGGAGGRTMRGAVSYLPRLSSPNGAAGLYVFDFQPNDSFGFDEIKFVRDAVIKTAPFLAGRIAFHPLNGNLSAYQADKAKYDQSDVAVYLDEDLYGKIAFLPLNVAESFGRLCVMGSEFQPKPRDIVICQTLPNQMPRVAGVISEVRQTPLSHVNLRAIQDKIPNAYIAGAMQSDAIKPLIGKFVSYKVSSQGFQIREATTEEVDRHFETLRPTQPQVPQRDLSKVEILPLQQIAFQDSAAFGVKTTNVATLRTFEFAEGTVPDGSAIPFSFYDDFMKHNGFYDQIAQVLASDEFQKSREVQESELKRIRSVIQKGNMPEAMLDALTKAQKSFPDGTSIRCRSSTNNEDLPGFSGAGLYDSCTHHPSEGHLSKSVKQVYASLWNFRAFEEREFYRIDHMQVAMGVLMHPNFSDELANGVAVTDDILYETKGNYYLNVQSGEDLVTNPNEQSSPEEILLSWWKEDGQQVVRRAADGQPLLTQAQLDELRTDLAKIHGRFRKLYNKTENDRFAMEVEFKITHDGKVTIKQARPWVY